MIYVRWRAGEPRRVSTFPPLSADHPSVATACVVCSTTLGTDAPVTLVAVGPLDDEARERHDAGRWFNAGAAAVHEDCVAQLTEVDLGMLVAELTVSEP